MARASATLRAICAMCGGRKPSRGRVYAWREIDPMPLDEVLSVVPAFHPVWAGADPELIALWDREAAHGNFRAWAKITHHLTVGMKESGRTGVDEDLLRWAYSKLRHRRAA